jgi:6-phosphogluconolactonase (cycloisomerase 2 family)
MACHSRNCRRYCLIPVLYLAASNALSGQLLYIGNNAEGTISSYVIDQDSGFLTELLPRIAIIGSPSSVVIHPNAKFVYVTNTGNPNLNASGPSVSIYSINPATGALTRVNSVPLPGGSGPTGAAIDPAGKFLVLANGSGSVAVFGIDASGALSPVSGSPFAAPQGPTKVVVHPNGKFAYVSAGGAGQIAAFSISANGALTTIAGSPFTARNNLVWMAMDKAGKFLFAAERQDNAVLVYSVDATTGALTQVGAPFPAQAGILGVAADPGGTFLYTAFQPARNGHDFRPRRPAPSRRTPRRGCRVSDQCRAL